MPKTMQFCDITDEGTQTTDRFLVNTQIEIGYRMEQYLTAMEAATLIDNCLYNPEWEDSIDMGLGELFYSLLEIAYTKAYGYDSFNYDMETYRENLIYIEDYEPQVPMGLVEYIFSPYSSFWAKFFAILAFAIPALLGGGFIIGKNRGGGGSSGGYGVGR